MKLKNYKNISYYSLRKEKVHMWDLAIVSPIERYKMKNITKQAFVVYRSQSWSNERIAQAQMEGEQVATNLHCFVQGMEGQYFQFTLWDSGPLEVKRGSTVTLGGRDKDWEVREKVSQFTPAGADEEVTWATLIVEPVPGAEGEISVSPPKPRKIRVKFV